MAFERVGIRAVVEGVTRFVRDSKIIEDRLKQVTGNLERAEKQSKKLNINLDNLSPVLHRVGLGLSAAGAAGGAFLFSATKLAARVETLGVVTETLGKNVGKTRKEIRELEQAVKSQGITLQGSRKAIALMIQSNIDLQHATDLARMAQNAAVIANINSTEAFERLVFVITSGNVRMARTLGLQVSFQDAYEATAKSLGKTTLELTQQEKVAARTNAVLASGANIVEAYERAMDTAGKKVLSLDRHLEESRRIMGELWLPAYAEAVDVATKFLERIEDASLAQQRGISATLGAASAFSALGGSSLVLVGSLPRIIAGFKAIGVASLGAASAIGVITAAVAIFVTSLARATAENRTLRDEFRRLEIELGEAGSSYAIYIDQAIKAAEGTIQWANAARHAKLTGRDFREVLIELLQEQGLLTQAQFEAQVAWDAVNRGAEEHERRLLAGRGAMRQTETAAGDAADEFMEMAEAEREAAKAAEELRAEQDRLKTELDEIDLLIKTDISQDFLDFRDKLDDLNQQMAEFETERIEAVAAVRADENIEDQAAALAELEGEYADKMEGIRDEIDQVTKAWQRQTAEIVFNLATQRLGLDGFTAEEIDALTILAGPQGLGLIDQTAVALLESLDELTEAMAAPGDQAPLVAQAIGDMAAAMQNPMQTIEEIAAAIRDIGEAAAEVARNPSIARIIGAEVFGGGGGGGLVAQFRQRGGPVSAGKPYIVGEGAGGTPELFVPSTSGMVLPNKLFGAMTSMINAVTSAIPIPGAAPTATAAAGGTTEQNFNLTVNSAASAEPIIADFNLLALMGERRI